MTLRVYCPRFPLSDYVEMIWHWDNYVSTHEKERILPIGLMELTFNLSGGDFVIDNRAVQPTPAIAVGCQTGYFVIDTAQPTTILSVLFKPGIALDLFGLSPKELHNQIVPLSDLWCDSSDGLYNQLMMTQIIDARFQIIERALLDRLQMRERHYAIDFALDALSTTQASIADLQSEIALSPPRFIQVFRDEIGFTPKVFSRLQRFHRVLDSISEADSVNWADLALGLGYYDQSHLINDFRKFAGISPSAYAPMSKAHNKNIPFLGNS